VFSTDQLPAELDERARFRAWRALEEEIYGSLDVTYADDVPFWGRAEFAQFGATGICQFGGNFTSVRRTRRDVARDGRDGFIFGLNRSTSTIHHAQRDRSVAVTPGSATLVSLGDAIQGHLTPGTTTFSHRAAT